MLNTVEVYNAQGVLKHSFPMTFPDGIGSYFIQKIDGLGPVTASVNSTAFGGAQDGEALQSTKVGKRNIVMTMGFHPNYTTNETVQDLRQALYYSMPPKARIKLRFLDTVKDPVEIWGNVEANVPTIFDKEPSVQLSIINTLPNFLALAPVVQTGFIGNSPDADIVFTYPGSAPVGFLLEVDMSHEDPTVFLQFVGIQNFIDPNIIWNGAHLTGTQELFLSTIQGNKYINKLSSGSTTNVLQGLTSGKMTMQITPDITRMNIYGDHNDTTFYTPVPVKISYTPAYIGI